jgi:hypothetical protein
MRDALKLLSIKPEEDFTAPYPIVNYRQIFHWKVDFKMPTTLKLTDFPGYISEGKETLFRQRHFFVEGSGNIHIGKSERLSILLRILDDLEPGLDSCLLYPDPDDTETKQALEVNTKIARKRNQLFFNGSVRELVRLCDACSDEDIRSIRVSILLKLERENVDWKKLFSSVYDPGFLGNPKSVVAPSAYSHAAKTVSDKHVIFIIYATAYFSPSFLIFGQTAHYDLFSDYAVQYCKISERFRNQYSHFYSYSGD